MKKKIDGIQNSTSTTIDKIGKITQVITNFNDLVATIATAVEKQSATTRETAGNISQAAVGINQVNEKVAEDYQGLPETLPGPYPKWTTRPGKWSTAAYR